MATTIVDKDHGYARLLRATRERLPELFVGVLTEEQHKDSELTVAEVGETHELGLGVPPRPWLRPVVDGRTNFIKERLKRVAQAVALGRLTAEAGMNLLGQDLVNAIRERIRAGISPELADSTKARKQDNKDTPLIHTAQFIGSITHRVGEKADL